MKYNGLVKYFVFIFILLFTFFAGPLLQEPSLQHYPDRAKLQQQQGLEYFVTSSNNIEESLIFEEELIDVRIVLLGAGNLYNDFIARLLARVCNNFSFKSSTNFINLYIDSARSPPLSLI